jgi:hypothetical protein
MVSVDARCTQCGHTDHGDPSGNDNYVTYDGVDREELNHGTGKEHGTETFVCPQCSGTCDLDECTYGDPCEQCATETVHNRCASSVRRGGK